MAESIRAALKSPQAGVPFFPAMLLAAAWLLVAAAAGGQQPPYDARPEVAPPYYRVRYEAATEPGGLIFPVTYTAWFPPDVPKLRGVIVHQHGCGEGSCKSGLTGAFDLHWQALARKHGCALVTPSYEQPDKAVCQMWCDPRNGSDAAFQQALADLGRMAGHPEVATVPWALWGHSGGGHWVGGMAILHPERVVAAWLRSGMPLFEPDTARAHIKPHVLPDATLGVPMMCNPGAREGGAGPTTIAFFSALRSRGGLVGVAVDPRSGHECGNQRYLAIPWLDACLAARVPADGGSALRPMPTAGAWLGLITGGTAVAATAHQGDPLTAGWLPNATVPRQWMDDVKDTLVADDTPPPAPTNVRVAGRVLTWDAAADIETGLAGFVIERDGTRLAESPRAGKTPFGRALFQGLQHSDTPAFPLVPFEFTDATATPAQKHRYRVIAVNTVGLASPPSEPAVAE